GTNERSKLFHHAVTYSHDDHELSSFLRLLSPLMQDLAPADIQTPFLNLDEAFRDAVLKRFGIKDSVQLVAIAPGASVTERQWGAERYTQVAQALCRRGKRVAVLGTTADAADARRICGAIPAAIDVTGKTNLMEAASLLSACKLFIGADSGLLHIAVALDVPTVSLFGPGREKKWAPQGNHHRIINKHLPCSPCTMFGYTPPCPLKAACMMAITPDEVIRSTQSLLAAD
ncbi:MAG TPA: glycosyltransferase family 9 protein, partial [Dissulfurispiraceae bacterium]|nr:glycosyltransferase family 9 protein [Dissulfurispiraceae bacterium]